MSITAVGSSLIARAAEVSTQSGESRTPEAGSDDGARQVAGRPSGAVFVRVCVKEKGFLHYILTWLFNGDGSIS